MFFLLPFFLCRAALRNAVNRLGMPRALLFFGFLSEVFMRPVSRGHVSKGRSAKQFRKNVGRTKAANVNGAPMRGGIRL